MSTPNPPGNPSDQPPWGWQPPGPPPPPGFPPPPQQPYPGYPSYPGYAGYGDPHAPYGRDPVTGLPLSDKSASTAGLLQLFFGLFGVGRFYLDSTQIAVAQLCLGVFGTVFTLFCFLGFPVLLAGVIWAIVDAIMMFTGSVKDNYGRKLR
jgi:TM2 domain-containing membrane protein YozV